jgi:RNA polymerase sigma-70 factor (ECF subfamily)
MVNPSTASSGLLHRVRTDDGEAWTRMVTLFTPLVMHWCSRAGLQYSDAEDVAQEVFQTVALRVAGFRRDQRGGTFRGWLRTITYHKVGDFLRTRRRDCDLRREYVDQRAETVPAVGETPSQESGEMIGEEVRILHAQVLKLIQDDFQPATWRAFVRVVGDGVSPKDVADELGLSLNAVYLAKSRIMHRVREVLGEALR